MKYLLLLGVWVAQTGLAAEQGRMVIEARSTDGRVMGEVTQQPTVYRTTEMVGTLVGQMRGTGVLSGNYPDFNDTTHSVFGKNIQGSDLFTLSPVGGNDSSTLMIREDANFIQSKLPLNYSYEAEAKIADGMTWQDFLDGKEITVVFTDEGNRVSDAAQAKALADSLGNELISTFGRHRTTVKTQSEIHETSGSSSCRFSKTSFVCTSSDLSLTLSVDLELSS